MLVYLNNIFTFLILYISQAPHISKLVVKMFLVCSKDFEIKQEGLLSLLPKPKQVFMFCSVSTLPTFLNPFSLFDYAYK